jgi:hypothetical protein
MARVAVLARDVSARWVRLDEVGQGDDQLDLRFPEILQRRRRPRQIMQMHVAGADALRGLLEGLQPVLDDQRQRVARAPQGTVDGGDAKPDTAHAVLGLLPKGSPVRKRLAHLRRPFRRMHDQGPHCFQPKVGVLGLNLGSKAAREGCGGAGGLERRKQSIDRTMVGRQQLQARDARAAVVIDPDIATFENHLGLQRRCLLPSHRCGAER